MSMEKMKGKFTSPEPDFSKMRSYWVQFPMLVNQVSIWSSNKKKKNNTKGWRLHKSTPQRQRLWRSPSQCTVYGVGRMLNRISQWWLVSWGCYSAAPVKILWGKKSIIVIGDFNYWWSSRVKFKCLLTPTWSCPPRIKYSTAVRGLWESIYTDLA